MSGKDAAQVLDDTALDDVLQEHADALITGEDNSAQLLEQYPASAQLLGNLFHIAGRVFKTLSPVEPSPEFMADLKAKLVEIQTGQAESALRWRERRTRFAGTSRVLATIMSVLAVVALVAQLVGSVVLVITLIVGLGRRRKSAAAA